MFNVVLKPLFIICMCINVLGHQR